MKDFKLTKDFVRLNNIITDSVLKAFNWDTFEGPLSRYDLGDLLHQLQEPEIFGFYKNTAITPGENSKYSLISELLGLSRGIADLQSTYDEWMTVIQQLRLPEQSFYETYQRVFDHQCKTVKDLNGFWRIANEVKDKCAELGCAIDQVKEKYQLFDKMYLGDITKPRKRFSGNLGRGYEKEPDSYQSELIEKWVMQGADRANVEAAFRVSEPCHHEAQKEPDMAASVEPKKFAPVVVKTEEQKRMEAIRGITPYILQKNISIERAGEILDAVIVHGDTTRLKYNIKSYLDISHGNLKKIVKAIFPVIQEKLEPKADEYGKLYNRLTRG